jgi:hypothetical protein
MRQLAVRVRAIIRSKSIEKLDACLDDAQRSGLCAMQRFVRTSRWIPATGSMAMASRIVRLRVSS